MSASGPLQGVRVLEFSSAAPGPYGGMLLADMGADVVTIEREGGFDPMPVASRGKRSLLLDLKQSADVATALAVIAKADVVIEGFRPGVMERLGLGPDVACAANPGVIYARMTGWGQDGPLARSAGHDINYIALSGALEGIGPPDLPPWPPLNLVGDFGGGSLFMVMGICAALFERTRSGKGQVIDAAMVDGAASLMGPLQGIMARGWMPSERGRSVLGGLAPYYRCYECADGAFMAVGAIEIQFYKEFLAILKVDDKMLPDRDDPANWPALSTLFAARFRTKTRADWTALFDGSDACAVPVLASGEAHDHPHNAARGVFMTVNGTTQPAPAPRFSRTPGSIQGPEPVKGEGGRERLLAWGVNI